MNSIYLTVKYPSSSSSKVYTTGINEDLSLTCDCPGWVYLRSKDGYRNCKHTKQLTLDESLVTEVKGEYEYVIVNKRLVAPNNIKFIAYLTQYGDGCDYTIDCGKKLVKLRSKTANEARFELKELIKEKHSWDEGRLSEVKIYEVISEEKEPIDFWYKEIDALIEQEDIEEEIETLQEKLNDLKKKKK